MDASTPGDVAVAPATRSGGEAPERAPPAHPDALAWLAAFGSPIALGTTLLLYFGWVRSQAQARAFGADASVFQLTPQDLVLRSVDVLFVPVLLLLLAGLLVLRLEPWLRARATRLVPVLRWSWLLAPLGLVLAFVAAQPGELVLPLLVFLAIAGTGYAGVLRRHTATARGPERFARVVLVVLLLSLTLFWQTERLARFAGEALAADLQVNLPHRLPAVIVYSTERLRLDGGSVTVSELGDGDADRYRYTGLYLLQRSGDEYFLLTDGWATNEGRLIVLADTEALRLEFGG